MILCIIYSSWHQLLCLILQPLWNYAYLAAATDEYMNGYVFRYNKCGSVKFDHDLKPIPGDLYAWRRIRFRLLKLPSSNISWYCGSKRISFEYYEAASILDHISTFQKIIGEISLAHNNGTLVLKNTTNNIKLSYT